MTKDNWIKACRCDCHDGPVAAEDCIYCRSKHVPIEEWSDKVKITLTEWIHRMDKLGELKRFVERKSGFWVFECPDIEKIISQVEKDAIEKTNKRWREKIGEKAEKRLWTNTAANNMHVVKKYHQGINDLVSDLLEDK